MGKFPTISFYVLGGSVQGSEESEGDLRIRGR